MRRGRFFAILGGIFGLIGLLMLGVGVVWATFTMGFLASAERTEGTVVALNDRLSSGSPGKVMSTYFGPTIFGGFGTVFTPVGAALFVKGRRILRQHSWLLTKGREVWAQISHVGLESSVKINGRNPYVVYATWNDEQTGRTYTATSDILRHDPGPDLHGRTHVRVLYDPADPDLNLVDLNAVR
jgi:hypothetical protein